MARRMATEQPIYDLILLLDPGGGGAPREHPRDLEQIIDRQGSIVSAHDWGLRPTAYEVAQAGDADYHLLQFQGAHALLDQLNHALKITDGVIRFRIIKLRKGTPDPPDLRCRPPRRRRAAGRDRALTQRASPRQPATGLPINPPNLRAFSGMRRAHP